MKYRVGGPLIDALMGEIGMSGGTMGGMLSGSIPAEAPARPKPVAAGEINARRPKPNGGDAAA